MSREFGEYGSTGYFHAKIESAANDCETGDYEITKKWGKVLKSLEQITYAISTAEAGDSGQAYPIFRSMKDIEEVKKAIAEVEEYLKPYNEVAEKAVLHYLTGEAKVD